MMGKKKKIEYCRHGFFFVADLDDFPVGTLAALVLWKFESLFWKLPSVALRACLGHVVVHTAVQQYFSAVVVFLLVFVPPSRFSPLLGFSGVISARRKSPRVFAPTPLSRLTLSRQTSYVDKSWIESFISFLMTLFVLAGRLGLKKLAAYIC